MSTETDTTHDTTGREAVRELVLRPLAASGLQRTKGLTEAEHEAVLKRLADYLSYLSRPSLEALADQILASAGGPKRNQWPSELLVRQMAEALERRPFSEKPIVRSWLASVEGPRAEVAGYLVQLYRHLRQHQRPVLPYDLRQVQQQATDDRRRRRMIEERLRVEQASDEERRWLTSLIEDEALAREIVARGQITRERKAGEVAA
ncbi:hypothetical protein [Falsigemmobacter faecalis]|uniref:DNA primase DnaG DnaB-binding domain-containing protein n=1 Tax=Falsigemmobacter faecalis TaxID=2488730 RepID=A0A3P3D777_9RHOB|nr:hypothetical protein [Falsigemmobacter faecalis]RRH70021.1 hypothetical protein EG244_17580 [Falsigemmobacter faecalis]